jgi:hypothetical protein
VPGCLKCFKKGLICPGYGAQSRLSDGYLASGKRRGSQAPRIEQKIVSRSRTSSSLGSSPGSGQPSSSGLALFLKTQPAHVVVLEVQRCLESVDSSSRMLLDYFSEYVSPMMSLTDETNGYRQQVLPFAYREPMVRRAVCVAATFHLCQKVPSLRPHAEAARAALISELRSVAQQGQQDDVLALTTWTAIILLIVTSLVDAYEDMRTLLDTLWSFVEASGDHKAKGPLVALLQQQTKL